MARSCLSVVLAFLLLIGCAATESGTGGPTATGVGAVTGAAAGAAIGQAVGGKDGWWIGSLAGAATGATAGAAYAESQQPKLPYGYDVGNGRVQSPYSVFTVQRNSARRGTKVYDTRTGNYFLLP
jgi:hypothetical protein